MADENDIGFELKIRTTADGTGAEQTTAGLEGVTQKAEETAAALQGAAGASREYNAQMEREFAARTSDVEAEQEITDLQRQQQAIVSTKLEAIQLEAAGRSEEAEALNVEVRQMTMALALQKQLGLEEEAALEIARETVAAQEAIVAAKEAQAAADAEADAASGLRGVGTAGRAGGMLAGALGLPGAGEIGFTIFSLYEVVNLLGSAFETARKIPQQIAEVGRESERTKERLAEMADEMKRGGDATADWEANLKEATEEISAQEQALTRVATAQEAVARAQAALAKAKIDADPNLTPEQKDAAIAKEQEAEDAARAKAREDADNAKIALARQKMAAEEEAARQAEQAAAKAKADAETQIANADALRKKIKEVGDQAAEIPAAPEGLKAKIATALMEGMAIGEGHPELVDQRDADLKKRADLESEAGQLRDELKGQMKAAQEAQRAAVEAKRKADEQAARAQAAAISGKGQIGDLTSDIGTSKTVESIQEQTAAAEAQARINEQQAREKEEADRKAKEAAKKQAEEDKRLAEQLAEGRTEAGRAHQIAGEGFAPDRFVEGLNRAADALAKANAAAAQNQAGAALVRALENFEKHVLDLTDGQRQQAAQLENQARQLERLGQMVQNQRQ